jgi:hypothetical protein
MHFQGSNLEWVISCYPLANLINACVSSSAFPDCLKENKVTPLFKSGDSTLMSNYRPITLSSTEGKVFEGVILNRIEEHISVNKLLSPYQFGYTKKSSCESAVLHLMNEIYKNLDEKNVTGALFIDLSKAFDSIFHPLLLMKLEKMGFSKSFVNLMKSYLSDRMQFVALNESFSSRDRISKGVFQGSKLGAILFIIYINSIFTLPLRGKILLYADDIAIVYGAKDAQELKSSMEYDLKILEIWFTNHFLRMNSSKTCYLLFNGRKKLDDFVTSGMKIRFGNHHVERVECFKYLGFWLDETLSFERHVKHIKSKILPMTYAIKRIRPFISDSTAKQLYFCHIHSHLIYMNVFWSAAKSTLTNSIAVIQRKCLRFIFKKYSFSPNRELFSESILPLDKLNKYNILLTAFKIVNNLVVNNVELNLVSNRHNHYTRQHDHVAIDNFRTRYGFANFFHRGFSEFNKLDSRTRNIRGIGRFKRVIREQLLDEFVDGN